MFTDREIQGLKPKEKMYDVREGKGFTVRVLPSGSKTFYYVFKLQGKRYFYYLGRYDKKTGLTLSAAREKYHAAAQLVIKGINPIDEENKSTPGTPEELPYTIARLIDNYLAHLENNTSKSYLSTAKLTLSNDVLPAWKDRLVTEIRRRDAILLVENVASRAKAQAHGVMKHARAMFTYALHRELVEFNPFSVVSAAVPMISPVERKRYLSDEEIKHIWRELSSNDPNAIGTPLSRAGLKLILITAQRPGEVTGIAKSEVGGKWWTIPEDRAKNGIEHRVYLSPLAISQLPALVCPWYFPSPTLEAPMGRQTLSHILSKKEKNTKGEAIRPQYLGLPRWTPHDLRRTASTKLSKLGCPDEIIDKILNHTKKGVIGIYNRNEYDAEKEMWLTKWADHLEELVKEPRDPQLLMVSKQPEKV